MEPHHKMQFSVTAKEKLFCSQIILSVVDTAKITNGELIFFHIGLNYAQAMYKIIQLMFFQKKGFSIKYHTKVDMPLNKETKQNQILIMLKSYLIRTTI